MLSSEMAMNEVKQHHQNRDRALAERTETIEELNSLLKEDPAPDGR
jgi:hypothetical protein